MIGCDCEGEASDPFYFDFRYLISLYISVNRLSVIIYLISTLFCLQNLKDKQKSNFFYLYAPILNANNLLLVT